jgi:hypothetical protein
MPTAFQRFAVGVMVKPRQAELMVTAFPAPRATGAPDEGHTLSVSEDGEGAAAPPSVHLLPPFDEYTVAYKDRAAILDPAFARRLNAGGGLINAVVVVNGRVAGNWKRSIAGHTVAVTVSPFQPLTKREARAVEREAARYAAFLGLSYARTR